MILEALYRLVREGDNPIIHKHAAHVFLAASPGPVFAMNLTVNMVIGGNVNAAVRPDVELKSVEAIKAKYTLKGISLDRLNSYGNTVPRSYSKVA
jgi:hypothetical protein